MSSTNNQNWRWSGLNDVYSFRKDMAWNLKDFFKMFLFTTAALWRRPEWSETTFLRSRAHNLLSFCLPCVLYDSSTCLAFMWMTLLAAPDIRNQLPVGWLDGEVLALHKKSSPISSSAGPSSSTVQPRRLWGNVCYGCNFTRHWGCILVTARLHRHYNKWLVHMPANALPRPGGKTSNNENHKGNWLPKLKGGKKWK